MNRNCAMSVELYLSNTPFMCLLPIWVKVRCSVVFVHGLMLGTFTNRVVLLFIILVFAILLTQQGGVREL